MKPILSSLLCFLTCALVVPAQTLPTDGIDTNTDLIFVGQVAGWGRTYGDNCESTWATFRILRVLKGRYAEKDISVRFSGHLGISERIATIVFANKPAISKDPEQSGCGSARFNGENLMDNTRRNLRRVEKALRKANGTGLIMPHGNLDYSILQ